jgi:23S rRNA (guanosine2251-2'-O)-methyltransferase
MGFAAFNVILDYFGSNFTMRKLHITELNRKHIEEFKSSKKWPVRVILDNVRSLHNIGSVFRTADAFLVECIYLCGISAQPPHPEIHKTALGATETVIWEYFERVEDAVKKAISDGYQIVIVEQTSNSISLNEFEYPQKPVALVFGNEVKGVSEEVLPSSDVALEIPQFGTKHSFNISVCAGIVLYTLYQQYINALK